MNRPYRKPVHHGKPQMTRSQGTTQLLMLLYGCTPEALARLDPAQLSRTHAGVTEAAARDALEAARRARGVGA